MSSEDIIAIIKWGPLAFFLLTFFIGMLIGMIKGRRKVVKGLIYTIIFVVAAFLLTPTLSELIMNFEIDGTSVEAMIHEFIENNEDIQKMFKDIPGLETIVENYPNSILSLVLFVVLVFVGLPLSFPIYIVYSIIYGIISKFVFKYSKYKKDENGKILRNEKGKKIKDKKNKHRLTAGLLRGAESVMLTSVILVPVGVVTRVYDDAKQASISKDLSTLEDLKDFKEILSYIDAFNDSFIGKATNSKANQAIAGYLSPITIDGEKTTMEKELSNIAVAAVYLEESGIIKLLSQSSDIKTLDISYLNIDRLDMAIEILFKSSTLRGIVSDGVNYVLENSLKDAFVDLTNDEGIIEKIKYNNADEVKQELLSVTSVIREIINSKLLTIYQNNSDNVVGVINEIETNDVEAILNKVLTIKILSKSMPGIVQKLLKDYGLTSTLTQENNTEFTRLIVDVVRFVKTMEMTSISDISEGNLIDNLVACLYKEGAIKTNSREALTTLLSNMSSSLVFDEILVTQLNKILDNYEIKLNSQMILNVNTRQDWDKELNVLENIFDMYDLYNKEQKVDFLVASELIDNLKDTKAMILALPISYQKLFPNLGIEVDLNKIKYIDYDSETASEEEKQFYSYWKNELVHLETISDELAKLKITSISDISLNLLEVDDNVTSLANIIGEVFTSDLLADGVSKVLNTTIADLLKTYEITLNDGAITNVNDVVNHIPYYIVIDDKEYEVKYKDNKYYIDNTEVVITDNSVEYDSNTYELNNNTIARIWESELTNLANVVEVVKTGEYTDKANLTIILNSVDDMELLKDVKNDLLIFAVKQLGVIDTDEVNKEKVSFTKEKNILLNVVDKYDLLKDIGGIDFKTMDDDTITDLALVLDNVLDSDIFGDYAAESIVTIASSSKITLTKDNVKQADTWESDLKLLRTALNMNKDSFNKTTINTLLTGVESSSLLGPVKEELILSTAKNISIAGVKIPDGLTASDIIYDDEKNAILLAADNLSLLEEISDENFVLKNVDTTKMGALLDATMKSKMFSNSIITSLVTVLDDNDIKHDKDGTNEDTNLIASIKSVEDWTAEITTIKTLLDVNNEENVTKDLFDSIYNSKLLNGCRATLMVKMVTTIIDSSSDLGLDAVTVSDLTGTDYSYAQYDIEKELLIKTTSIDNFKNINNVDRSNEKDIVDVLNLMKDSKIFASKYDEVVSSLANPIKNNANLTSWGLTVTDNEVTNWAKEIDALLTIKENADAVSAMDSTNYDISKIGSTLDAMDRSTLIDGSESAANSIVRKITGNEHATITKENNSSWTTALDEIL